MVREGPSEKETFKLRPEGYEISHVKSCRKRILGRGNDLAKTKSWERALCVQGTEKRLMHLNCGQ